MNSPFKYHGSIMEAGVEGSIYKGVFPLPTDGLPNSEQWIEITVTAPHGGPNRVEVDVVTQNGRNRYPLAESENAGMRALCNMLYGVARRKTIELLEPVQ